MGFEATTKCMDHLLEVFSLLKVEKMMSFICLNLYDSKSYFYIIQCIFIVALLRWKALSKATFIPPPCISMGNVVDSCIEFDPNYVYKG